MSGSDEFVNQCVILSRGCVSDDCTVWRVYTLECDSLDTPDHVGVYWCRKFDATGQIGRHTTIICVRKFTKLVEKMQKLNKQIEN